ncbi:MULTISPECIES: metal ABC transporter ATP-binding protein [Sodalis]|uniref:Zinc/manganese transport system ATP-binding protein n=1 Tax=Sodalis ligni TaxID=2697027 RepID=A0A4R1N889_9GAMM|nr:ABC transporter ATP-binding protein [Sodalis ligni]TCL03524.1 zinc/manganese transport system ATP-binding protein [Sodalis ligni]
MITLNNLVLGYQGQRISRPLNGTFETGSLTAIIGANGTGKSTLLKTLAGLLPPVAGNLAFAAARPPRIAYLPQQSELDRQFPVNVFDVVSMGCWPATGLLRRIGGTDKALIHHALQRVGLEDMPTRPIDALSGGQFQRMLFARLLVQQAPLVLLDEPFTGIDRQTCDLLLEVIGQLHRAGQTIIVVLHDHGQVARHFPQTLLLTPEQNRWGPSADILSHRTPQSESCFCFQSFDRVG